MRGGSTEDLYAGRNLWCESDAGLPRNMGVPKMRKCISAEVTNTNEVSAELKLKVLGLGLVLGLATAVTNPAFATHDYNGLAEYSALTSAV